MKLEDVLKKLNKGKAEEDKYKMLSEIDTLNFKYCSIGSFYLNHIMNESVIPLGAMTLMTGWEGSGKTSIALLAAKDIQDKTGKVVVVLDGEQTITDSHIERFNLDKERLIIYKESVLENMLDTAEIFSQSEDIGGIIVDSIKSFYSVVVEGKSAEDYTIGVEAKKLGTRLPIINANCARRKIALIVLNQWRENPGVMHGDSKVLPGGNWNKYMPYTHLDFTKKDLIKDEEKGVIGHKLDVRVRKSKGGAFDKKDIITLNFYYDGGFNQIDEYAQLFKELGIAESGGAGWMSFLTRNGEEKKVQGTDKFAEYLKENPEDFEFLKDQII